MPALSALCSDHCCVLDSTSAGAWLPWRSTPRRRPSPPQRKVPTQSAVTHTASRSTCPIIKLVSKNCVVLGEHQGWHTNTITPDAQALVRAAARVSIYLRRIGSRREKGRKARALSLFPEPGQPQLRRTSPPCSWRRPHTAPRAHASCSGPRRPPPAALPAHPPQPPGEASTA